MRVRLGLALGALLLAFGLAAYPALSERAAPAPLPALAVPALLLYAAGLVGRWGGGLAGAIALLALEYLLSLYLRDASLDVVAPVYAVALFLCAELGWLALEGRETGGPWPGRAFGLLAVALGGGGLGFVVLALAVLPLPGGPLLTAAGGAAVVAAAVLLARLANASRRPARERQLRRS